MNSTNEKVKSGVYGFVIADAMGVPIEFTRRNHSEDKWLKEMVGYGSHSVPEGTWSDDSSMTIATMDSIQEMGKLDYEDVMKKFVSWFHDAQYTATDVVFDIGNATAKALSKYNNSSLPAIECGGKNEYDNGNGSLMRILPVSMYLDSLNLSDEERVEVVCNASAMTHGHDISKLGCVIYDRFMHELLSGKDKKIAYKDSCDFNYSKYFDKKTLSEYDRVLSKEIDKLNVDEISSSGFVVSTLEAALWSTLTTNSYEESIVKSINLGDDTDTVGAITGSMTGVIYGYENIPQRWIDKLRKKEYLDTLINKFSRTLTEEEKVSQKL